MTDILTNRSPVAAKPHRCNWCHGLIRQGSRYRYVVYVDGGELWTWRGHLVCEHLAEVFRDRHEMSYDEPLNDECWLDALLDMSRAELDAALVGVFSPSHPDVQRIHALHAFSRPTGWSTHPRFKVRELRRSHWRSRDLGELVVRREVAHG